MYQFQVLASFLQKLVPLSTTATFNTHALRVLGISHLRTIDIFSPRVSFSGTEERFYQWGSSNLRNSLFKSINFRLLASICLRPAHMVAAI